MARSWRQTASPTSTRLRVSRTNTRPASSSAHGRFSAGFSDGFAAGSGGGSAS
jgi:hypothetical protein